MAAGAPRAPDWYEGGSNVVPEWAAGYIGIPFADHGRDRAGCDCWGLVRLVLAERFGVAVPSFDAAYAEAHDRAAAAAAIAVRMGDWREVASGAERAGGGAAFIPVRRAERAGDVALLRTGRHPCHVGVIVAPGLMLHVERGLAACLEAIRGPVFKHRLIAVYRHVSIRDDRAENPENGGSHEDQDRNLAAGSADGGMHDDRRGPSDDALEGGCVPGGLPQSRGLCRARAKCRYAVGRGAAIPIAVERTLKNGVCHELDFRTEIHSKHVRASENRVPTTCCCDRFWCPGIELVESRGLHQGPGVEQEVLAPGEGTVRLTACPNPFTTERFIHDFPAGLTLAEMAETVLPRGRGSAHVAIGDWTIPRENWARVRPKPGAEVIVRAVPGDPGGGGGGKKSPLRTVLMLAVIVAASYAAPLLATELTGLSSGLTFKLVSAGIGLAISTVGMLVVNAIAPPARPQLADLSGQTRDSPTLSIAGARNAARPFGVVPIVLGRHRMAPPYGASPFTELVGDDQYLRLLMVWGYGPLDVTDPRIGETPLGNFSGVETEFRRGYQASQITDKGAWAPSGATFPGAAVFGDKYTASDAGTVDGVAFVAGDTITFNGLAAAAGSAAWDRNHDKPLTLYSNDVFEETLSVALTQVGGWQLRTSQAATDEISIDITFPQGLVAFAADGSKQERTVAVEVEYSAAGTGIWVAAGTITTTARRASAIRKGLRWTVAAGQYDVRLRRTTADTADSQILDTVFWTVLRSIKATAPVAMTGICMTALRILATNQLSGVVEQFNAVAQSILPDWDSGTAAWVTRPTSNPAALYRTGLQGVGNARAAPDSRIDLAHLQHWHELNAAEGREFNGVVDYAASVRQVLADVAAAGRASPARTGGLHSVVIDEPKAAPVQHFTPRNSWGFRGEKTFGDLPHGWRVRFVNRAEDWRQDERIVYDDGYGPSTATKFETLELAGVTDPDQIWRDARYHVATARLRPETFSFFADVEHIVCTRGDWVKITYDVILTGLASGRIKAVATDGGGNVTGLTVDEALPMEAGKTYGLSIRTLADAALTAELVTAAGDQTVVALAAAIPAAQAPEVGDLFGFGELGAETIDLLIKSIEPGADLSAHVVAVPLAPAVHQSGVLPRDFVAGDVDAVLDKIAVAGHGFFDGDVVQLTTTGILPGGLAAATDYWIVGRTADTFQLAAAEGGAALNIADGGAGTHTCTRRIPDYVTGITAAAELAAPAVSQLRSDGTVLVRDADGSWVSQILATFAPGAALARSVAGIETRYRPSDSDGAWIYLPAQDPVGAEIGVRPVEDGETYDLAFRTVLQDGRRSDWSAVVTHAVTGKTAPPADVAGFSAQQVGSGVTFKWGQVPDRDLEGYEIRYSPQGAFSWDDATAVTRVTRGTLITNEGLPPGSWTAGVKAKDTSGNFSALAATFDIDVVNSFDVIETHEHAPRWVPYDNDGWIVHWVSGKLVPSSLALAADLTDAQLWDQVNYDPVAAATWVGQEFDLGFDANGVRAWADIQWVLAPGSAVSPDVALEIDYRDAADAYDGFAGWTLGRFDGRFVKPCIRAVIPGNTAIPLVSGFAFTADQQERAEGASGAVVAPGGTAIVFAERFHTLARISITPQGALVPGYSGKSETGFMLHLYDVAGADVGGTADWDATGV